MTFFTVVLVVVAILGQDGGVNAGPEVTSWTKLAVPGHWPRHRYVRDLHTLPVECREAYTCFHDNAIQQTFLSVLGRFDIGEIYTASQTWCDVTTTAVGDCWSPQCHNVTLRNEMTFNDNVQRWICSRRESFHTAARCFTGSLGDRLDTCPAQALQNLRRAISTFDPIAFSNYLMMCSHDVIDALGEPCTESDRMFLKEFYDYTVILNLDALEGLAMPPF